MGPGFAHSAYIMTTGSKTANKRPPVFGILSILSPVIGGLLLGAFLLADAYIFNTGMITVFACLFIVPIVQTSGIILSIIAFIRRERHWLLPLIGLLMNAVVLIWFAERPKNDWHF